MSIAIISVENKLPLHQPVLLNEFLKFSFFEPSKKNISIWDGTVGLGGHLLPFIKKYSFVNAYASDCDIQMLQYFNSKLKKEKLKTNISMFHANYSTNPFQEQAPFDIILLDLGISSLHLDHFSRGISYKRNDILDMRLNQNLGEPAYIWLMEANEKEIADILFYYGEEYLSRHIARAIIYQRKQKKIKYMDDLKNICIRVYGRAGLLKKNRHTSRHPYVKTLQAIRIYINDELTHLKNGMLFLPYHLKKGGRLFIISFHSLEDRIVKQAFRKLSSNGGQFKVLIKKVIQTSAGEIEKNSRSRSAKMRILEKIS